MWDLAKGYGQIMHPFIEKLKECEKHPDQPPACVADGKLFEFFVKDCGLACVLCLPLAFLIFDEVPSGACSVNRAATVGALSVAACAGILNWLRNS